MELLLGASLIVIEARGRPEVAPAELEAALDAEMDRLAGVPPSKEELARVRLQRATKRARAMQTAEGRADRIGMYAALLDDPRRFLGEQRRDEEIGPGEVSAFATTWLAGRRRKYLWFLP
jgi:predicted Zn-dependent peptidase